MNDLLPFVVIGMVTGSVYGLAATGLVLTYKTSGIFNFAHGSVAALAVFLFYFLHDEHGVPWPLAGVICIAILGPIMGVLLEFMARRLAPLPASNQVAATIGLVLIVLGLGQVLYGANLPQFPAYLPTETFSVGSVLIGYDQLIVVCVSLLLAAGLFVFLRRARTGMAMRAVVDDANLLTLSGQSAVRVRRVAWMLGTSFACLSGLLIAPSLSLDVLLLTMLIVQAFGAAAIGSFTSIPMTALGGLVIGIAGSLTTKWVGSNLLLSGLPAGLPFIILFVLMILLPKRKLVDRRAVITRVMEPKWRAPTRVRVSMFCISVVVLLFVPKMVGRDLDSYSGTLIFVIIFLSLGLVVRLSGQVSLCHLAFAAVGSASLAHLTSGAHVPWLAAVIIAGLITIPVGAIIAIPAIRLSPLFLAIATFGFGVLLEQMFYQTKLMFGITPSGIPASRPNLTIGPWDMSTDRGFYYVILVAVVLATALVIGIERGRLGRLLRAMSDSPTALETHGNHVNTTRILVFCISAFMAGIAGALLASLDNVAIAVPVSSFSSLTLFALLVIQLVGAPWYAVVAAASLELVPVYLDYPNIIAYQQMLFGASAVLIAVGLAKPPTVPMRLRRVLERLGPPEAPPAAAISGQRSRRPLRVVEDARPVAESRAKSGIEVSKLTVRFGGAVAVRDLTLRAPRGTLTGLIGPNGAGKTTTFNVCSGLLKPSAGTVCLDGRDISALGPARRAIAGIGRTFQRVELFHSLSVEENISLGREAGQAGRNPVSQLRATRSDRAAMRESVEEAVAATGVGDLLGIQAGLLSTGQKRLVELARCIAGGFDMLLLDEPSSGLDARETEIFGQILRELVQSKGIFLVEHDMALVQQVCDDVYVLDFGELIFHGSTREMMRNEAVQLAYLGQEIERSQVGHEPSRVGLGAAAAGGDQ